MTHPALQSGRTAVITGAAMGIGLAAARRLASFGMNVCMTDIDAEELSDAAEQVRAETGGSGVILQVAADVGDFGDMVALQSEVQERFGAVSLLMNNAVTRLGGGAFAPHENWVQALATNLQGVVNGVQAFAPAMIRAAQPGVIVNVGSKQGITTPPGNTAYNVAKAGVKAFTEGLQHELRNADGCKVSAHLLIPGWTTTGKREHKPGAWLPDQVVDRLLEALEAGRFYIVCPDDEVSETMDKQRILWAAGDIVFDRPPLSRWHPDYQDAFAEFDPPLG
ncbi:MAG: SDR family NAD(P)-dependent oxidoreductase [Pseudomonadota bacterium]